MDKAKDHRPTKEELTKKLREGKERMAERCLVAAKAIADEAGVLTWEYTSGLRGRAWSATKHIKAPKPTTRRRLYIWAHECAHVALGHGESGAVHRQEYEVERWAQSTLRRHGIPVPRKEVEKGRKYVAMKIRRAERRGAKCIDKEARSWSERKPRSR